MQFPWLLFLLLSEQDAWLDLEGNEFRVPRPHAFTRRATGGATGLTQLHCASLTRAAPGRGSTRRITVPVTGNSPKPEGKPLLRRNALKHETDSVLSKGTSPVLLLEDLRAREHYVHPTDGSSPRLHQKLHLQLHLGPRRRTPPNRAS